MASAHRSVAAATVMAAQGLCATGSAGPRIRRQRPKRAAGRHTGSSMDNQMQSMACAGGKNEMLWGEETLTRPATFLACAWASMHSNYQSDQGTLLLTVLEAGPQDTRQCP